MIIKDDDNSGQQKLDEEGVGKEEENGPSTVDNDEEDEEDGNIMCSCPCGCCICSMIKSITKVREEPKRKNRQRKRHDSIDLTA